MRNVLLASLVAFAALLPASGCILGCGAFDGGNDTVYAREGGEMLIMCGNGGFVANLQTTSIEGRMEINTDGTSIGVKGDDQSLAFDWVSASDGGMNTPQLGGGAWQYQSLDKVALDHADVMCKDLETRTWWAQQ
ncbi:MAG TPA: hypothetical protein VL326_26630 [Kofleriaceae bacterium]|jgi:hypothetical protein|nr:hypothetical protein [Kofleriaceae bacterium]